MQHRVLRKLGITSKHQPIATPGFISRRQSTFNFSSYIQLYIFNQQRLWADGILIPTCIKPCSLAETLVSLHAKMTLKHTERTRRFIHEHHDNCTECQRAFKNGETTHLGYTEKRKLIYIGDCCSNLLRETIIRHSYSRPVYMIPQNNDVLWRFMDFTKFLSLLKSKALFFTRADKFQDPFEGAKGLLKNKNRWDKFYIDFLTEAIRTVPGGQNLNKSKKELIGEAKKLLEQMNTSGARQVKETFINCWYESKYESEAMWKLYTSALDQGIAIKTTYKKLYLSLNRSPDISIGKINYIDYSKNFAGINDSFWYKRKSFEHEREVRAVIKDFGATEEFGKVIPVKLEILIDRVYLSPTSQSWFRELVEDVMIKYKLNKKIFVSDMNALPFH